MLKHPNANSLSKIENSAKLRKYLKIQESLENQAPECLVQLLEQNLNVKSSSNFNRMSKTKFLKKLMKIAKNSPQNVYACYTKGVQEKLSFHTRTTPHTMENLEICEKIIKEQLIPNLIGKDILNAQFREVSSLPLKIGGLNIKLPSDHENYLELSKETSLELESQDPVTAKTQQEKIQE